MELIDYLNLPLAAVLAARARLPTIHHGCKSNGALPMRPIRDKASEER